MEQLPHHAYTSRRHPSLTEALREDQLIYVIPASATRFFQAVYPGDFAEANELIVANGWNAEDLIHPTVLARREGELVGIMGTREREGFVLAGPLALLPGRKRPMLALALLKEYERVMRRLGLSQVVFDMAVGSDMYQAVTELVPDMRAKGTYVEDGKQIEWFVWDFHQFSLAGDEIW